MKQLFKILLAVGVIAFAVSMTAGSCGKTPDAGGNNNNNNSGGGNSGGGDGGGGTPAPEPGSIKINVTDAMLAKVSQDTNILLKLSQFPSSLSATVGGGITFAVRGAIPSTLKKAFEIVNDKAKEGIVLVGKGSAANAGVLTATALTALPNSSGANDGIFIVPAATANDGVSAGLNFFSIFANLTHAATTAEAAADAEPFVFSGVPATFGGTVDPLFWCVATAPALTATVAATDKLVGAHKADCYVATRGNLHGYGGTVTGSVTLRTTWFNAADPFKREIKVAVVAIKTDGKTIGDLFSGNVGEFNNGINATEMAALLTASGHGTPPFKTFNIKIVNDADFTAAP